MVRSPRPATSCSARRVGVRSADPRRATREFHITVAGCDEVDRVGRLFEEMVVLLEQGHELDRDNLVVSIEIMKADARPTDVLTTESVRGRKTIRPPRRRGSNEGIRPPRTTPSPSRSVLRAPRKSYRSPWPSPCAALHAKKDTVYSSLRRPRCRGQASVSRLSCPATMGLFFFLREGLSRYAAAPSLRRRCTHVVRAPRSWCGCTIERGTTRGPRPWRIMRGPARCNDSFIISTMHRTRRPSR